MQKPLEKVYIVLINYKSWQDTVECLESLFKLSYSNFKAIVVDNDSQDGSLDQLMKWAKGETSLPFDEQFYYKAPIEPYPVEKPIAFDLVSSEAITNTVDFESKLIFVESKTNLGFAGGNNIGIKLALAHQAKYIWLLNNDTVVSKNALAILKEHFEGAKDAKRLLGILGAKLLYYHNPNLIQAILGRYKPAMGSSEHIGLNCYADTSFKDLQIRNDDYIVGASMFISAEFVKEVGMMSEDYFLYFEEIDWVKRGRERNYEIDVCLDALVYHKEGASIGGAMKDNNNKSELSDYYSIRNRLIITKKFYKKYLFSVYLSLIFVAANRIRRNQFSRIPLILKAFKSFLRSTS